MPSHLFVPLLETEMKGEPAGSSFDVDALEVLPEDDKSFSPINGCVKCGGRIEGDYEGELHCTACKPKPDSSC